MVGLRDWGLNRGLNNIYKFLFDWGYFDLSNTLSSDRKL